MRFDGRSMWCCTVSNMRAMSAEVMRPASSTTSADVHMASWADCTLRVTLSYTSMSPLSSGDVSSVTMDETAEIVPSSIATKGVVASVASRGTTSRGEASLRLS